MSRTSFDSALLDAAVAAGATHEPVRVRDVAVGPHGVEIELGNRRVRASVVIGADGANSLVRRRVCAPFRRAQLSIAAGVFAPGMSSDAIDLTFTHRPAGYGWSFPRPDHLAIGVCAQADTATSAELLEQTTRWIARAALAPRERLRRYSWPIPSLSPGEFGSERPAGSRWLLVGDAAGLVDPLTREGIYFALKSGALAAEALLASTAAAGDRYAAALRATIYPELAHAAAFKAGFFRPGFTRLMVEALARSPRVAAVVADLVAGRQPYRTLRRRLLSTFELRLAWQLLALARAPAPAERSG
jgi:flavin-dependent dehydrogenase